MKNESTQNSDINNAEKLKIQTKIRQIPKENNDFIAIVNANLQYGNIKVSDFGTACPKSTNCNNPKEILELARQEAQNRAKAIFNEAILMQANPIHSLEKQPIQQALPSSNWQTNSSKQLNGGGSKPASEKQTDLIKSLCKTKGLQLEDVSDKAIISLTGAEANEIIKKLQANN